MHTIDKTNQTLMQIAQAIRENAKKIHQSTNELWVCDDSFTQPPAFFNPDGETHFITNRVDTYHTICTAIERTPLLKNTAAFCYLSDFDFSSIQNNRFSAVYFRISKEKALSHYLINTAIQHLGDGGQLVLVGHKSEGIKGYADRMKKKLKLAVTLEKKGDVYTVVYTHKISSLPSIPLLDDQDYTCLKKVHEFSLHPENKNTLSIYSKPGVYGWKKCDVGTQLLLETLIPTLDTKYATAIFTSALDLGCGSGIIALSLKSLGIQNVTATDSNVTAMIATEHNAHMNTLDISCISDDCAKNIDQRFDLVVCNPPFHKGFGTQSALTTLFVEQAINKLSSHGEAWFVVNSFVPVEKNIDPKKATYSIIINNKQFKVLRIQRSK